MSRVPESSDEAPGTYSRAFFDKQARASYRSAAAVMPVVLELVNCRSVVDVGCGVAPWLRATEECGIDDYLGIDGDYVPADQLCIPSTRFLAHDLRHPLDLGRRFDLAICVEVAEHLPAEAGSTLVDTLTSLAPVVLFSAAVPQQGGDGHVNERWPDYWGRLFWACGFGAYDCIRLLLWNDDRVDWWYRQNLLLFADRERASERWGPPVPEPLALIHPAMIQAILTRLAVAQSAPALPVTGEEDASPPFAGPAAMSPVDNRLDRIVRTSRVRDAVEIVRRMTWRSGSDG